MNNPLSNYFRTPAISIQLPSRGKFWPEGAIDLPVTGELDVYPMTARDEILFKTPDSLLNGNATKTCISSCIPAIKDPSAIPSIDLDTILVAIRIASVGENMAIKSKCPKCKEQNEYEIDLRAILDSIQAPKDLAAPVTYNGLKIYLRPQSYADINAKSIEDFERQRAVTAATQEGIPEAERMEQFKAIFTKLTDLTVNSLANGINYIELPDGTTVDDRGYILEYVSNASRELFKEVKTTVAEFNNSCKIKPLHIKCADCEHEYDTPIVLDQSTFFE
jgi:hypothetical protein